MSDNKKDLAKDAVDAQGEIKAISADVIRGRMAQLEQDAQRLMQMEQQLASQLEQVREQRAGVAGAHQVLASLVA